MEVAVKLRGSADLPPRKNFPDNSCDRKLGVPQSWSRRYDEKNSCLCKESNPGSPARSQSLHWL